MPKLQVNRGIEANLPTLDVGEPAFTTDSHKFYVGSAAGNILIGPTSPPPPPPPVDPSDVLPLYPPAVTPTVFDLGLYVMGGGDEPLLYWKPCGTCDAPTYTLDGPLTAAVGVETDPYTVQPTFDATGVTFTPATSISGTFDPTTLTGAGYDELEFTFTPSATGTHNLSVANDRGVPAPTPLAVVVTAAIGCEEYLVFGATTVSRATSTTWTGGTLTLETDGAEHWTLTDSSDASVYTLAGTSTDGVGLYAGGMAGTADVECAD